MIYYFKRFSASITLMLLCTLLAAVCTGCMSANSASNVDSVPETPEASEELSPMDLAYSSKKPDTVILKIDGEAVYWNEFFYWLNYYVTSTEKAYGEIEDWAGEMSDGVSYAQYVMGEAANSIITYRALEFGAEALGASLSEEDWETIQGYKDYDLEYYGDAETLQEYLNKSYMTTDLYNYLYEMSCLYYACFDAAYGENGELCADGDVLDYAGYYGYTQAKQIMLLNTDDEGNTLSDEEVAANYATLERLLAELGTSEDPVTLFDEFIEEYNEGAESSGLPKGYLFRAGEMLTDFEEACATLAENEYSGIVESDYGCHIILRLSVDPDTVPVYYYSKDYDYTLRYLAALELFQGKTIEEWKNGFNVIYTVNYDNFDLSAYLS